jgi:glutathione S-transferase
VPVRPAVTFPTAQRTALIRVGRRIPPGERDQIWSWREYFFDHFTAPDAHFFWCCRRVTQLEVDLSSFSNVTAHFKRMQERPSVKKLLAYEKDMNEGFAKTA